MPYFRKGEGSRNSYEMRLYGLTGMDLLISPSFQTYTANIGIWRGSFFMYANMFWVTLDNDFTSLRYGGDIRFHDANMIYLI